ncbi:hypothetical protein E3N88_43994 [Mikania micrantha]|uniref:Uncharacterized protein n=1 Tax=Mikania micrantha TaxID=192012 RepID=A0A5N6LDB8_9ASTR|nr:hypothetical protein E3N88_43994 [Mikania micrantha]
MKLGLLGSTETHRGTRWANKWAFAVREAQTGEFEFSEIRRGTRRPIIFHHRANLEDIEGLSSSEPQEHQTLSFLTIEAILAPPRAAPDLFRPYLDELEPCEVVSMFNLV